MWNPRCIDRWQKINALAESIDHMVMDGGAYGYFLFINFQRYVESAVKEMDMKAVCYFESGTVVKVLDEKYEYCMFTVRLCGHQIKVVGHE